MKGVKSEKQDGIGLSECTWSVLRSLSGNDLREGELDLTSSLFFLGAGGWGEQVSMSDPKKWWLSSRPPWKPHLCWMKCHFYLTWSTGTASSRQVNPELGALGAAGMVAPQKPGISATALRDGEGGGCEHWHQELNRRGEREKKIIQLPGSGQVWKKGFKMELQIPKIKGKINVLKLLWWINISKGLQRKSVTGKWKERPWLPGFKCLH